MPTQTKTAKKVMEDATAAFDAFKLSTPSVEVPEVFRDLAEKSITQARTAYSKMKAAAEETTDMVEDTYESAREGAFALGVKALDMAKVNTDASFAFARDLFGVKTFAEAIELQTAFVRKQFDSLSAQTKEMQELSQKYFTETTKPVTVQFEKTFKDMKAS